MQIYYKFLEYTRFLAKKYRLCLHKQYFSVKSLLFALQCEIIVPSSFSRINAGSLRPLSRHCMPAILASMPRALLRDSSFFLCRRIESADTKARHSPECCAFKKYDMCKCSRMKMFHERKFEDKTYRFQHWYRPRLRRNRP